jgi:hypothetical protein
MYLLVQGLNLKKMAIQGDKSTGKDEGEVKSTPSIIKLIRKGYD